MYARLVTFTGTKDIDGGLEFLRDTVAPELRSQKGWTGTIASADRKNGVFVSMSLWLTEVDRDASESAIAKVRDEAAGIIGGTVSVDFYEQVVFDAAKPPKVGAHLLLRPLTMDPARVDENITFFNDEILPRIKAQAGYLAVRNMVNRTTGECVVGSLWDSKSACDAAAKAAEARAPMAEERGITFQEMTRREIVFVDIP